MDDHSDNEYEEKIEKMISLTISAARGTIPMAQISLPLLQIANGNLAPREAQDLARVLSRILNGERDPITLVETLTPELAEVVWEALDAIEMPLPQGEGDDEREEISFEELIEKVGTACTGQVALWQSLWDFTGELESHDDTPPEIRRLGSVLRRILAGERQKHVLDELASQHRWAVEELLDWLVAQSAEPGQTPNAEL